MCWFYFKQRKQGSISISVICVTEDWNIILFRVGVLMKIPEQNIRRDQSTAWKLE